jgi:hypothetical protein
MASACAGQSHCLAAKVGITFFFADPLANAHAFITPHWNSNFASLEVVAGHLRRNLFLKSVALASSAHCHFPVVGNAIYAAARKKLRSLYF